MVFLSWLLIFPNALYIVTDLIHLKDTGIVPIWFDAVLLFAAALAGIIMGYISLLRAEIYLLHKMPHKQVPQLMAVILFFSSFGVYLGRFLRWNSWDVFSKPVYIMSQILHRFIFPLQHGRTWVVTGVLSVFFFLLWLLIKKIPGAVGRVSLITKQ